MTSKALKTMDLDKNPLIYRNMVLFLLGKLVSLLGSRMMNFAIGLYVLKITGSGISFALTMIISTIPAIILSPIAGVIADKGGRKIIVVATDILSGILLIGIFLTARYYGLTINIIYLALFLLSALNTFFSVAMEASIPNIVDENRLARINSYNSSINSMASILGPVLGGLIYGFVNIEIFIILNGLGFILSGISEIFIDFKLFAKSGETRSSNKKGSLFSDIMAGFNYVKRKRAIFITLIFSIFVNFFFSGFSVSLPHIINTRLGLSSEQYGLVQSAFAIGSLLFSLLYSIISDKRSGYFYSMLGLITTALFMMITGLPTINPFIAIGAHLHLIYFMAVNFLIGCALVFVNLPFFIMLQRETPDEYRGRVSGLLGTMSLSISPLGMLLGGFVVDYLPSFILPLVSGGMFLMITLIFSRDEELKTIL